MAIINTTSNGHITMTNHLINTLLFSALAMPILAQGYEVDTHQQISVTAYQQAEIFQNNKQLLKDFGIDTSKLYPDSIGKLRVFNDLIGFGSINEDMFANGCIPWSNVNLCPIDNRPNPFNHFYNPYAPLGDQALRVDIVSNNLLVPPGNLMGETGAIQNYTSPDWALEDKQQIINPFYGKPPVGMKPGMNFSWADAREYFYAALTAPAQLDRDKNLGLTFESIGHIIHHIQDMAQPQHVRNDPHDPITSPSRPNYTHASLYEEYTNGKAKNNQLILPVYRSLPPIYPALDPTLFKTPRDFWAKKQNFGYMTGLAPFTHDNFYSAGTNEEIGRAHI